MYFPHRLQVLSSFLDSNHDFVADIGSDHGLLVIHLSQLGFKNLVAVENKIGPYNRLNASLKEAEVENVTTILADGIQKLTTHINTIVIAGMGGSLIASILKSNSQNLKNIEKLVLLPHNQLKLVRQNIEKLGFMIVDEDVVQENEKFYEIIVAKKGKSNLNQLQLEYGPINLAKKRINFLKKWQRIIAEKEFLLKHNNLPNKRYADLEKDIVKIKEVIEND